MCDPTNHQIAISYASQDGWIAKDIHELLTAYSLSVYCSELMADETRGLLRENLLKIYANSWLNILIWSHHYASRPVESIAGMEKQFIVHRHVCGGQADTLMVILTDNTDRNCGLEHILAHDIRIVGLLDIERKVIKRLHDLSKRPTTSGIVCHPPNTGLFRSTPSDCQFTIMREYWRDPYGRWEKFADVWVDFPNPHGTDCVYLIPSGLCTVHLRHTGRLRSEKRYLDTKRSATEAFIESMQNRKLVGHWFFEKMGERDIVALYCGEYDRFLNENFERFLTTTQNDG